MAWKKWTALAFMLLLALCLSACQDGKRIEGLVTEVQADADGNLAAFVLEDGGKRIGVLLAEKTNFWPQGISSGTTEEFRAQFQKELQVDALASVWCYSRRDKLETEDGIVQAYWATSASIEGGLEREALTLRDGTPVDVLKRDWFGGDRTYRLADGTELLRAEEPRGPGDVIRVGQEGFETLNVLAQEKVQAYYEEQGLLYDELEELEKSYAAYLELGEAFACEHVSQDVAPAAASGRVMYFQTSLMLPEEYGTNRYQNIFLCAAFDRETGEQIDIPDLFAVPWEEVCRRLPELVDWEMDNADQISEKLKPEYLSFDPDALSVWFPAGTLEEEDYKEYAYGFSVSYSDVPEGFFQPWAIPESTEE